MRSRRLVSIRVQRLKINSRTFFVRNSLVNGLTARIKLSIKNLYPNINNPSQICFTCPQELEHHKANVRRNLGSLIVPNEKVQAFRHMKLVQLLCQVIKRLLLYHFRDFQSCGYFLQAQLRFIKRQLPYATFKFLWLISLCWLGYLYCY